LPQPAQPGEAEWREPSCPECRQARLAERDRMVLEHIGLAIAAGNSVRPWRYGMALEDANQIGQLGLVYAANAFDPRRGWAFTTYAWHVVRRALWTAVGNEVPFIRVPHDAARLGHRGQAVRQWPELRSGEAMDGADPREEVSPGIDYEGLHKAISRLASRDQDLLYQYYFQGLKIADIARASNLSSQRIQQLLDRARRRLGEDLKLAAK